MSEKLKKSLIITGMVIGIILLVQFYPKFSLRTSDMKTFDTSVITYHYESSDQDVIDEISEFIDKEAQAINLKLKFEKDSNTNIYVYPNQETFHRKKYGSLIDLIKLFNNLDWYVGDNVKDKVILVSPLNPGEYHSKENIIGVIPHEYVHAVIYQINPKTPLWLNEGLALYLTNGEPLTGYRREDVPTYDQIQTSNPIEFANIKGYQYAHTYIEFLEFEYGFDSVLELLGNEFSYKDTFKKSDQQLYDEWLLYLDNNY